MTTHKLDEETRAKLVGLLPVRQGASIAFTPASVMTLPEQCRPIFYQRSFTKAEREEIREFETENLIMYRSVKDSADKVSDDLIKYNNAKMSKLREYARISIVNIEKLYCSLTGELLTNVIDNGSVDKEIMSGLAECTVIELYDNAKLISSLTQQEKLGLK
jgi:hypothetical protein